MSLERLPITELVKRAAAVDRLGIGTDLNGRLCLFVRFYGGQREIFFLAPTLAGRLVTAIQRAAASQGWQVKDDLRPRGEANWTDLIRRLAPVAAARVEVVGEELIVALVDEKGLGEALRLSPHQSAQLVWLIENALRKSDFRDPGTPEPPSTARH
jgi:hypothetical protein